MYRLLMLIPLLAALVGCGNSGPLYLPTQASTESVKPAVQSHQLSPGPILQK